MFSSKHQVAKTNILPHIGFINLLTLVGECFNDLSTISNGCSYIVPVFVPVLTDNCPTWVRDQKRKWLKKPMHGHITTVVMRLESHNFSCKITMITFLARESDIGVVLYSLHNLIIIITLIHFSARFKNKNIILLPSL